MRGAREVSIRPLINVCDEAVGPRGDANAENYQVGCGLGSDPERRVLSTFVIRMRGTARDEKGVRPPLSNRNTKH
jgi:hypothetical protein